jgi:serine/threonine protein kinase
MFAKEDRNRQEMGVEPQTSTFMRRSASSNTHAELSSHKGTVPAGNSDTPTVRQSMEGGAPMLSSVPSEGGRKLRLDGMTLRLTERIGEGSFGEVWRAEGEDGSRLALKVLFLPVDHNYTKRELQALRRITVLWHESVLNIRFYELREGRLYVVMDLAERSLRDRLEECQRGGASGIPVAELVGYLRQAAEGLDYLHGQGLQHRDVKPENILLVNGRAKVADFGLVSEHNALRMVTVSNSGTPSYMAPEAWMGKISAHSDQYSLAMMYLELRLGKHPFADKSLLAMIQGKLDPLPLPRAEEEAILKALADDPRQRYGSCREFVAALERATGRPGNATCNVPEAEPILANPAAQKADGGKAGQSEISSEKERVKLAAAFLSAVAAVTWAAVPVSTSVMELLKSDGPVAHWLSTLLY